MRSGVQQKRCAVYTRKSTDEGLELSYNSLDAQRDACMAYVKSQAGMGWTLIDKHYDDGGYSGGNMNRPALVELKKDIECGLVDTVVVYKLDRLSRSIFDFADLFKLFEKHNVSFVSVTQQLDTSNAAGRMMLNILMSFAQFEREMAQDRIRDKVYATRKRGMWTGGVVPYAYKAVDKKLVVDPAAAPGVRYAFSRYVELGSVLALAKELEERFPRVDGLTWTSRHVDTILRSAIYAGKIPSKRTGEVFDGVHEAIVDEEAFRAAQEALAQNGGVSAGVPRHAILAPLKGLLRCGTCGSAMSPGYTKYRGKASRRYVYYRCSRDAKGAGAKCAVSMVPGDVIERAVFGLLREVFRRDDVLDLVSDGDKSRRAEFLTALEDMDGLWNAMTFAERERVFRLLLKEVVLGDGQLSIRLNIGDEDRSAPFKLRRNMGRPCLVVGGDADERGDDSGLAVTKMFRVTHKNLGLLTSGTYMSKKDLAAALGISGSYFSRIMRMQFLSPTIVERIFKGELPEVSVEQMSRVVSPFWAEQEELFLG